MAFDGNNQTGSRGAGSRANGARNGRRRPPSRSPRDRRSATGRQDNRAAQPPKFKGAPKTRRGLLGRRNRTTNRPVPLSSRMERTARQHPGTGYRSAAPSSSGLRPPRQGLRSSHQQQDPSLRGVARRGTPRRLHVVDNSSPPVQSISAQRRRRRPPSQASGAPRRAARYASGQNPRGQRPGSRPQRRKPRKPPSPMVSTLRYALRLLIVGIGLGVLAGTVLSSIDPSLRYSEEAAPSEKATEVSTAPTPKPTGLRLGREMSGLKGQIEVMLSAYSDMTAGVFVVDIDTGSYLDIDSRRRFSSASTIKLPILVALFEEIDQGTISLDEQLTMTPELIAAEAGEMQFLPPGTQFSVLETATEMIRISDNTATNMLIDRLGGPARLNQRFQSWGLQQTQLSNLLPDLEGTNTISPNDLVNLMGRLSQGQVVSLRSRDRLFKILRMTQTNDLLPQGLGPGAVIAHKTGNIGKVIGDVGLVDMPSGKQYIIMAMVERPHGDWRAEELIRNISTETYQFLEATGSTSEQMSPTMPHSNIADQEPKRAPSIMTVDP